MVTLTRKADINFWPYCIDAMVSGTWKELVQGLKTDTAKINLKLRTREKEDVPFLQQGFANFIIIIF